MFAEWVSGFRLFARQNTTASCNVRISQITYNARPVTSLFKLTKQLKHL
jgi:hypothetical protein